MGTEGLPKARKSQGSRGIVVIRSQFSNLNYDNLRRIPGDDARNVSTSAGSSSTVSTDGIEKLRKIAELCKKNPNFIVTDRLYRLLYDNKLYEVAYQKLKSKPGNMTPGIVPTTLDGMSTEVIDEIIEKLKSDTFEFHPNRRIKIPKSNGGTRPVTIAPPRDKLVQEVMRMILEVIYEPSFADCSHGFRTNRSCHTALRSIRQKFGMAR